MNETKTRTWTSRQVADLTGATYRQLDHWCAGGVFGDHHKEPGSGQRRRFTAQEVFEVAVVNRVADTMHALSAGLITSGSREMYVDVVRVLRGETIDDVFTTHQDASGVPGELEVNPTRFSSLIINLFDLRDRLSEEILNAQESA